MLPDIQALVDIIALCNPELGLYQMRVLNRIKNYLREKEKTVTSAAQIRVQPKTVKRKKAV